MTVGSGLQLKRSGRPLPVVLHFKAAWLAAPVAVSIALSLDLALAIAATAFAPKILATPVALTSLASIIPLVVALGARSERAFLGSIVILTGSCVLADLPLHRSGAALFAAIAGAAVLAFVEAGGAALEPKGGGTHVGHPARAHAIWVGLVAIGGAAAGWLLLSVDPELSDLGLAALVLGVLAAVCLIALAAMLAATAIAGRKRL